MRTEDEIADLLLDINDRTIQRAMTDRDRNLARVIYSNKQMLCPLGMIEFGIVVGRMIANKECENKDALLLTTARILRFVLEKNDLPRHVDVLNSFLSPFEMNLGHIINRQCKTKEDS